MKIVSIVGARPQFVKVSALCHALSGFPDVTHCLVHTGQHYDAGMSEVFFRELGIPCPDHNLEVGSGGHGLQTGRMLERLEGVLMGETPDRVLLYGDTNSTLAGALAAAKVRIPVAHVEAGLRSFNRAMPEEINRIVADQVSDLLFPPTEWAVRQLEKEGIPKERIRLVGDVMYDVVRHHAARVEPPSGDYILATIHRAENTDHPDRLKAIFEGLGRTAERVPVKMPLHPRTRKMMKQSGVEAKGIELMDPVGYLEMMALEKGARLIVTDSGGIQKEAFFCRVPCVTVRDETEWRETVELGWNHLVRPESATAVHQAIEIVLEKGSGAVTFPRTLYQ